MAMRHAAVHAAGWTEQLPMLCKALSCAKLAWMIDAVLVAISHVSGSHQLGRDLHEDIIFSILDRRLLKSSAACCESEMYVETYVFSF